MANNTARGFVLICQSNGQLEAVIRDDFGFFSNGNASTIYSYFDSSYEKEIQNFMKEASCLHSFCKKQVRILTGTGAINILLFGTPYEHKMLIVGTSPPYQKELQELQDKLADMDRALKNKNTELDQFAHIVSHDLKAPLSQSKLIVHLLEKRLQKDKLSKEVLQLLEMLNQSTTQMTNLIDTIHAYSKSGLFDYEVKTFSLDELLEEITSNIKSSHKIMFHFPDKLHNITTNRTQLLQVLSQLMDNAVQYHHLAEGNVTLHFHEEEDVYWFEVIDDGPGIPNEYHENIFEIFNKANRKRTNGRTGFGLSIAKKLVENAGGVLSLESKVGKGSNFKFSWPK